MTTANVRNVMRIQARLVKNPTDLSAAFPYGGTALGLTKLVRIQTRAKNREIFAEEFGVVSEVIYGGESPIVSCVLREMDNDALAAIFPDTVAGSSSGDRVIRIRATAARAGRRLSTDRIKLLIAPTAGERHPAIYIPRAVPALSEDLEIAYAPDEEFGTAVVFYATPDSSNRIAFIGKIEDLTI